MNRFWIKTVNIILIIGMFLVYNMTLEHRAQAEEIAGLQAELESSNLQLDEYEKALNRIKQIRRKLQSLIIPMELTRRVQGDTVAISR